MITKKQYKSKGFKIKESGVQVQDERLAKIEQIKSIIPSLVNSDGAVDISALDDMLGNKNLASNNQGYSLNFAGKGLAKIKVDVPTEKELKVEIKQSKNFDVTENVMIRGDNIDVLKILQQNYTNKVKMIYIDPPYNTGQANFIYPDSFKVTEKQLIEEFGLEYEAIDFLDNMLGTTNHSSWMFEMYPRLRLAMDLLTDDGIIFISIDDNEQANLKIMCDEIFGRENVDCFIWRKTGSGRYGKMKNTTTFRKDHEYIIVAYKNIQSMKKLWDFPDFENEYDNPCNDPRGNFKSGSISIREEASNPDHKYYYVATSPAGKKYTRQFAIPEDKFNELDKDGRIYWGKNNDAVPSQKIFINERRYSTPSSVLSKGSTYDGTKELDELMQGIKASDIRPKPSSLLFLLVQLGTSKNNKDIVLDFFAGSGTTGQAVMELNKEDEGNRKFILAQIDEPIDKQLPAYKFCEDNKINPVISSICIERVDRAGDNLKNQSDMLNEELDIGYKVFSLTPRPELITGADNHLELNVSRATTQDTLYNMMAASGEVILTIPIKEIEANLLYKVADSYYVLGECKTSLDEFSSNRIYIDGYADINLENWLNIIGLNKENVTILY